MISVRRAAVAAAACSVLGGGAAAFAVTGGADVETLGADIVFSSASIKERECDGPAGEALVEQIVVARGRATGDPRLSGETVLHLRLLNDATNGAGVQGGTLRVREPGSGAWKAQGRWSTATSAFVYTGGIVGEVRDPATSNGTRWGLTGPFSIVFGENGSATGHIGGRPGEEPAPAAIHRGGCSGPFAQFDLELPPPEAVGARRGAPSTGRWGG